MSRASRKFPPSASSSASALASRPAPNGSGGGSLVSSTAFRTLSLLLAVALTVQMGLVWQHQRREDVDDGGRLEEDPPAVALGTSRQQQNQQLRQRQQQREDVGAPHGSKALHAVIDTNDLGAAGGPNSDLDLPSLLSLAGISLTGSSGTQIKSRLPTPTEIASMYGPTPIIHGLESSCPAFQSSVPPANRYVGPAGMLNTGTNMLSTLLRRNCYLPQRPGALEDRWKSGMIFQVPWGKHNPPTFRLNNVAQDGGVANVVQTDVLPVVIMRDPVAWMDSMCRHPYAVQMGRNCMGSRLVRTMEPVSVTYPKGDVRRYDSLLALWRVWYDDWTSVEFPALFVRFEDLLFHPQAVVQTVCDCAGGRRRDGKFYIKGESAKGEIGPHAGGSGYLESVVKYGNATRRGEVLTRKEDRDHVKSGRYAALMDRFRYSVDGI